MRPEERIREEPSRVVEARPDGRLRGLAIALALPPYLWLVHRLNFLTDDAYIAFRYGRNLARGLGLRYNPGTDRPEEGYTQFLWVLWSGLLEGLGVDVTVWSRVTLIACGVVLLWLVAGVAARRWRAQPAIACLVTVFLATLPPFAAWSTGGLETMLFALLFFATWRCLLAYPEEALPITGGILMLLLWLTRADAVAFVGLLFACGWLTWMRRRPAGFPRTLAIAFGIAAAGAAIHVAWRYAYYGHLLPNTAAKVTLTPLALERGVNYAMEFFLTYPVVPLLAVAGVARLRRLSDCLAAHALIILGGTVFYAVLVGGDFMPMRRFFVVALPFVALLLGELLSAWSVPTLFRRRVAIAGAALAIVVTALPAFDVYVVPRWLRARFHYNWNLRYMSEWEQLRFFEEATERWAKLGRALKMHTEPGESLVFGGIGAVGYYSDLFIFDMMGLVSPEVAAQPPSTARRSAGHERAVSRMFFLDRNPTYLVATFTRPDERRVQGEPTPGYHWVEHALPPSEDFPEGSRLVLLERGPEGAPR